jgi:hypothetical protein
METKLLSKTDLEKVDLKWHYPPRVIKLDREIKYHNQRFERQLTKVRTTRFDFLYQTGFSISGILCNNLHWIRVNAKMESMSLFFIIKVTNLIVFQKEEINKT